MFWGKETLTKSGLNFLPLVWIECMKGSVFFGRSQRETVLCIWLTSLIVLKSVVRNPQEVPHIYLTDVWNSRFCWWEKRCPPPYTFSLVSFGSGAKGFLLNRPHSLVSLWVYNEIYLDFISLSGFIQTLFSNNELIFSAGDLKSWFLVAFVLSLGLALFGGLIMSLRFCDKWALVFVFLVCNHHWGPRALWGLSSYFSFPPCDASITPFLFYFFSPWMPLPSSAWQSFFFLV